MRARGDALISDAAFRWGSLSGDGFPACLFADFPFRPGSFGLFREWVVACRFAEKSRQEHRKERGRFAVSTSLRPCFRADERRQRETDASLHRRDSAGVKAKMGIREK